MNILSIDSGIEKTGYAVINHDTGDPRLICSGLIKTIRTLEPENRLLEIYESLQKLIKKHRPSVIVIEKLFFAANLKTAISVSQSQGALLILSAKNKLKVEFLTPLQIKQIITGYGNSDKKAIQKMLKLTLNIDIPNNRDDEADAIACGLAYCYLNKNLLR